MLALAREQREREHFDSVYGNRHYKEPLQLPKSLRERYVRCSDWKVYGKECMFSLAGDLEGSDVLEMGCGCGTDSILLADRGARVYAYDISPEAINLAAKRAEVNGVSDRISFRVASKPTEAFPGKKFDLIFGNAILHHIDICGVRDELHELLKPTGRCVFREPVILSSMLGKVRGYIPWYPSNPTKDEKPLTYETIMYLSEGFESVELYYFECFSRIWYLFKSNKFIDALHRLDGWLLENFGFMKRFASVVVIHLRKEKDNIKR